MPSNSVNTDSSTTSPPSAHGTTEQRRSFVSEQYERLWDGVYEKARNLLDGGERDISRLHLFMRRNFGPEFSDPHLAKKYRDHERQKLENGFIYDKQLLKIHDIDPKTVTLITDAVKMRYLIEAFGPEVERILETGSGWGKALFNLWRYGGPADADYYSLELTESGRRIAQLIADESTANIRLKTHFFDYYHPDFSFLTENRRTCFYTHHSIEQIPELDPAFIDNMLEVPGFHRCVHFEPVGWQIPTNNWLADGHRTDEMKAIDKANRKFSEKRNQNSNLYPLLREYEKKGKIRIYICRKYLCSHLLANATTMISWGKGDGIVSDSELLNSRRDDLLADAL